MSVISPPGPRRSSDPATHDELEALVEALIEEARQRARRRRQRKAAAAALLVLAGLAVYLGLAHRGGAKNGHAHYPSQPTALRRLERNGPLTIFTASGTDGIATVETVGRRSTKILWRCPGGHWCGEPVSSAWAPDGRRLAVTLDEITLEDPYPFALHVVDVESGRDVRIPAPGESTTRAYAPADAARVALGCWPPAELAWSPDGTRLAYRCSSFAPGPPDDRINVLDLNAGGSGFGFRTLRTHGPAYWPSWSPDGTRIVYSTAHGLTRRALLYAIDLEGSHRRLLATDATAPAWSPEGARIAYESRCGLRLVTPAGRDATLGSAGRCRAIGPRGLPAWSPHGNKIAIETSKGIYVVNADGSHLLLLTRKTSSVLELGYSASLERPSWRPD